MTTKSMTFRKDMISEINNFVQRQARALSMDDLERLLIDLPLLRQRLARIPPHRYPFLAEQLRFLARFVEEEIGQGQVGEIVGEAGFALLYFQRATDLIPDSIPGLGLLDDAIIVRIVLHRHAKVFENSWHAKGLSWPVPGFDVDQLLSVVSPIRLDSFCLSLAVSKAADRTSK
jgi:uncharacterized membrane protein YkvA (DUF1232 family)